METWSWDLMIIIGTEDGIVCSATVSESRVAAWGGEMDDWWMCSAVRVLQVEWWFQFCKAKYGMVLKVGSSHTMEKKTYEDIKKKNVWIKMHWSFPPSNFLSIFYTFLVQHSYLFWQAHCERKGTNRCGSTEQKHSPHPICVWYLSAHTNDLSNTIRQFSQNF